jgi:AraC-like DNA-binding protein
MPAVAVLTEGRSALGALRRALPRGSTRVVTCRSVAQVRQLLARRLSDAIVVSPRLVPPDQLRALARDYPAIPVICYAPFRPDDGELLHTCAGELGLPVAVEGVDDAVVGALVARLGASARRQRAMADAPRLLRLRSELQREVWAHVLAAGPGVLRTDAIAKRLRMSREHLSREFAMEAAPNLKRVIDLARVAAAAQLLQNPAVTAATAARLLGFASSSHLGVAAHRVAGVPTSGLGALGPKGVLNAFAKGGRGRSRV